jgi:hypothetical protein
MRMVLVPRPRPASRCEANPQLGDYLFDCIGKEIIVGSPLGLGLHGS